MDEFYCFFIQASWVFKQKRDQEDNSCVFPVFFIALEKGRHPNAPKDHQKTRFRGNTPQKTFWPLRSYH